MQRKRAAVTLDRLMDEYRNNCPTENLLSDAIILPSGDREVARREAMAAVYGMGRTGYYIDAARSLVGQMDKDLSEVSWRMLAYYSMESAIGTVDGDGSNRDELGWEPVRHRSIAQYLLKSSEVLWTFYAVSLQEAWYFLQHAVKWADPAYIAPSEDEQFLELIRTFRNHMIHRDGAAGHLHSPHWKSMSREEEDAAILGYQREVDGRVSFIPVDGDLKGTRQYMPIREVDFQRFQEIVNRRYEHLQTACLGRLRSYFETNPSSIIPLDQVGATLSDHIELIERKKA